MSNDFGKNMLHRYGRMERKHCLKSRQRPLSGNWNIQTSWPRKGIIEAQQGDACMKSISKWNANHPFSCSLLPIQMKLSNDMMSCELKRGIDENESHRAASSEWKLSVSHAIHRLEPVARWHKTQVTPRLYATNTSQYKTNLQNTKTQRNILVHKKNTKNILKHDTSLHKSPKKQCKQDLG